MIEVKELSAGYDEEILHDITFSVQQGEMFGILGPNGSGKTTLLKAINNSLANVQGEVLVEGRHLFSLPTKEIAKMMAVLPQHQDLSFAFSVEQTVLMGRYPYQKGLFKQWSKEDWTIVEDVMEQTGVAQFRHQSLFELSGGERQRVFLAQALAQQPRILLLDEPTNHLDFSYQKQMLDALKEWTIQRGLTVVAIFHDLNLASLYCDRLLLLHKGCVRALNTPEEVLEEERLSSIYQSRISVNAHPHLAKPFTNVIPSYVEEEDRSSVDSRYLDVQADRIYYKSPKPLKCYSSAVLNAGFGWYEEFINLHVDHTFQCEDPHLYLSEQVTKKGHQLTKTVGMMTAAMLEDQSYMVIHEGGVKGLVVVTAGTSNAVDIVYADQHVLSYSPGTINTWVFIDGELSEEAYVQTIMTATEAKVRALADLDVRDPITGTLATGTSTDSTLIGSTQEGTSHRYGGPISPLGRAVGKAIFHSTRRAVQRYLVRKGEQA